MNPWMILSKPAGQTRARSIPARVPTIRADEIHFHGNNTLCLCNMGWDPVGDISSAVSSVLSAGAQVVQGAVNAVSNISWGNVANNLSIVGQGTANFFVQMNPTRITIDFLKENPLTEHSFSELNKFSGNMLTTYNNVGTLPGRVARGDAISKKEIIEDALLGLEVATVVLTGGSALAWISAGSQQLSRGTIGQTSEGRTILMIIAAAAAAAAIAQKAGEKAASTAAEGAADQAFSEAATQSVATSGVKFGAGLTISRTPTIANDPTLSLIAKTTVAGATGGSAGMVLLTAAENAAVTEFAKKNPPYGGLIASTLIGTVNGVMGVNMIPTGNPIPVGSKVPRMTLPNGQSVGIVSVTSDGKTATYLLDDGTTYSVPIRQKTNLAPFALMAAGLFVLVGGARAIK